MVGEVHTLSHLTMTNADQLNILAEIFSDTERPSKVSITLCKITRDLVVQYEDLDDEWFKELSATIDPVAPHLDQREPMTINQVQEFKAHLEKRIREMLIQFSDKTGLCVNGIEVITTTKMDGGLSYWPEVDASL